MLLYDFVQVRRSLLVTNAWLISNGPDLVTEATGGATGSVSLGRPRTRADALVLPVAWIESESGAPFSTLTGDLQTARWSPSATHLSLSASCDLAAGHLGRRPEELATQRDAELAVRAFLAALATSIEAHSGSPSADPAPDARATMSPWPVDSPPWH